MNRLAILILLIVTGCKVGPNYQSPENTVGDEWMKTEADEPFSDESPQTAWWKVFEDPLLEKYIDAAVLCNKEILRAEAAICGARALREVSASKLFPQINGDLSAFKANLSKNLIDEVPIPRSLSLFNALFDASWEIDLFGKIRRTVELADAHVGSTIEERNDLLVTTLAEIARNYMELRSFQKRSELTKRNIELLEQASTIVRAQFNIGTANLLDLNRIDAELDSARSSLPDTHAQIYRNIYALSILTGEMPDALVDELLPIQPLPRPPEQIAIGLRSDLLRRRPDVRRAERQLAAATAGVGVAVASFYPSISLLGAVGLESLQEIKKLFRGSSRTWAYGGNFNLPIFQGGKLVGTLKAAEAECCMAGYQYQNTVLTALQDAEGSLVTYSNDLISSEQMRESANRINQVANLTTSRFDAGVVSLFTLLESEREAVMADLNLLEKDTTALIDLVSLYKALGGGWQCEAPDN
jgi:NodT family efflux transporter outer membrane factor (OMF) lipoprotein